MNNIVERCAVIHHGEGLIHHAIEHIGHFGQYRSNSLLAADRETMGGQEELGALFTHAAQGLCPFSRVALRLLWIAGIGECPDEEVTGTDRLVLGNPGPGMVIGLTARVVQCDIQPAH